MSGDHGEATGERAGILARARLVVFDVDGVLTDGRVVYSERLEVQAFDVKDGFGIAQLVRAGVEVAWISGRGFWGTRQRAEELGVRELHLRAGPKDLVLAGVQERLGIPPADTVSMGDDVPDLGLAERSALFVAPADAHPEVRARAGWVCAARGGRGAARELCDAVLAARGR